MKEKKEKNTEVPMLKWLVRNLLGIAFLMVIIVIACSIYLRVNTHHGKEIIVPDFTNMEVEEAVQLASMDNLKIEVIDSVYIRRMGRGLIYSQNPKSGSKVKNGRRILITINSVNPKKVQMPNLVGYSMRQAKAELNSRGLTLGRLEYVSDIATNNVLKQRYKGKDIKAGTMIDSGSQITLVVGLNEEDNQTYIPDFTGLKYLRAVDVAHDSKLNVKRLVFDKGIDSYTDSIEAVVYRQSPVPSEVSVIMGTDVTLYLKSEAADQAE